MTPVGFLGLGLMGDPIARRLLAAGHDLVVWNRTADRASALARAGAAVADDPASVFRRCSIVLVMLAGRPALDAVFGPLLGAVDAPLRGTVVVNLGTVSPAYSAELAAAVAEAGGDYVEAPVSGSRVPAERGELVGMIAGPPAAVARVAPLLDPLCRRVVACGAVPDALRTKLAVNHYLVTTVAALAETVGLARRTGLDLAAVVEVLDAGPMASAVSTMKLAKVLADDFTPQAALGDVSTNCDLIAAQAATAGARTPILDVVGGLYRDALRDGHGADDMIAVLHALS